MSTSTHNFEKDESWSTLYTQNNEVSENDKVIHSFIVSLTLPMAIDIES